MDTRANGFGGSFGPPSLAAGVPRDFPLAGQCGLPPEALAVSLNVTATNALGPGFFTLYPAGGLTPLVSTLNYLGGETVANAAIVPLGAGTLTVVAGVSGADLIVDVNGYFSAGDLTVTGNLILAAASTPTAGMVLKGADRFIHNTGIDNTFVGIDAGPFTSAGAGNTGVGAHTLETNPQGDADTAIGAYALQNNADGDFNTATGAFALNQNLTGGSNTATGANALQHSVTGGLNTAVGAAALIFNVGGSRNTAVGRAALFNNTTGSRNTALGEQAGSQATGDDNVYIAHAGVAAESATTRIGTAGVQTRTFIAAISGVNLGVQPAVVVNSSGQLGINASSARFKEAIEPMGEASRGLFRLRAVTFRYRPDAVVGPRPRQYGLIAEEVAEVYPELVAYGADGQPETVLYQVLPALLLNELQRQERVNEIQAAELAALRREQAALRAQLARLSEALAGLAPVGIAVVPGRP